MLRIMGVSVAIYPLIAHVALWLSLPRLAVGYLLSLLLLALLFPPRYKSVRNVFLSIIVVLVAVILINLDIEYILLYLPPIIIPIGLLIIFSESLQEGKIPLITQFARLTEGSLDTEREKYTRLITKIWVAVFLIMTLEAIILSVWAPIEVWSWFTHIGNYIFIAFVVIAEFIYRKHRFKLKELKFEEFVISLVRYRWKQDE